MSTKERLLARLERTPGEYTSGQRLAEEIGVSRNAVWKAVKALRDEGYQIDAVTNRGYALAFGPDRLSPSGILSCLEDAAPFEISVRRTVDSTNAWARERACEGAPEGTVVVAEGQSAGRGRLGRAFYSPEGTGLYLSILLRPSIDPSRSYLLTCSAAVATARAIESVCGRPAQIKWVNDVYCGGRKVAGILTEGSFGLEDGRFEHAVVGVGINVRTPAGGWPEEIAQRAGVVLEDEDSAAVRCRLAAALLQEFWSIYERLPDEDFAEEYRRRCFLIGKTVTATAGRKTLVGRAIGLDEAFRLVVECADGSRHALSFGDVSVAWKDDARTQRRAGECGRTPAGRPDTTDERNERNQ